MKKTQPHNKKPTKPNPSDFVGKYTTNRKVWPFCVSGSPCVEHPVSSVPSLAVFKSCFKRTLEYCLEYFIQARTELQYLPFLCCGLPKNFALCPCTKSWWCQWSMCAEPCRAGTRFGAGVCLWPKPCVSCYCSLIFALGNINSVETAAPHWVYLIKICFCLKKSEDVETLGEMFSRCLLMDLFFTSPEVFCIVFSEEKLMECSKIPSVAAEGLVHGFYWLRLISIPV